MAHSTAKIVLFIILCFYLLTRRNCGLQVLYSVTTPNLGAVDFLSLTILNGPINLQPYGFVAANFTSLAFELRSCKDSGFYLSESTDGNSSLSLYNIHFDGGADACTAIRKRKLLSGEFSDIRYREADITDCDSFKSMWISWADGLVQFGNGSVALQNTFFNWQDTNELFPVNSVYIYTTHGGGRKGHWKILVNVSDVSNGRFSGCSSNRKALLDGFESSTWSKTVCASLCFQSNKCIGFNYNNAESRCELLTYSGDILDSIPTTSDTNWKFYAKCYSQYNVCVGCFF